MPKENIKTTTKLYIEHVLDQSQTDQTAFGRAAMASSAPHPLPSESESVPNSLVPPPPQLPPLSEPGAGHNDSPSAGGFPGGCAPLRGLADSININIEHVAGGHRHEKGLVDGARGSARFFYPKGILCDTR